MVFGRIHHDPFQGLLSLQRELDRAFGRPFVFEPGLSGRGAFPAINVFRNPEGYAVHAELPGVEPSAIEIEAENRTLVIRGKRETEAPEGASFHRRERDRGEFSRSVHLAENLDLSKADATFKNGLLIIRIPKREEAKPRHITVTAA